jgi:2-polyprenyl-3-methyl-5-hydroxy-6-metoxy-1,4-benzoquinol methylase
MSETPTSSSQRAKHWDTAYETSGATGVSWFQPTATASIQLIERLGIAPGAAVIDVGGGASSLADDLLDHGFTDVSVLDVSRAALAVVRQRLGSNASVSLLQEDLLTWKPQRRYDLWHDRAVFHFLVDQSDQETYLRTLRAALRPAGFVIMATFASDGPKYCSGLPVSRYSSVDLSKALGPQLQVVESFRTQHVTPAGVEQPFAWVAARCTDRDEEGRAQDG